MSSIVYLDCVVDISKSMKKPLIWLTSALDIVNQKASQMAHSDYNLKTGITYFDSDTYGNVRFQNQNDLFTDPLLATTFIERLKSPDCLGENTKMRCGAHAVFHSLNKLAATKSDRTSMLVFSDALDFIDLNLLEFTELNRGIIDRQFYPSAATFFLREISETAVDNTGIVQKIQKTYNESKMNFHSPRFSERMWTDFLNKITNDFSGPHYRTVKDFILDPLFLHLSRNPSTQMPESRSKGDK